MRKKSNFRFLILKNSKRAELGVEEALLELVMLGFFIVIMFIIVSRAGTSYFSEQELLGLNSQRIFQSLSFHDGISINYDSIFFPGAKIGVTGTSESDGTIVVGVENSSLTMKYDYVKKGGTVVSVSADSFPIVLTSSRGNVISGDAKNVQDNNRHNLPCSVESRPLSVFLATSSSMEEYAKNSVRISPERFFESKVHVVSSPPSSPLKMGGDAYLLITKGTDSTIHVSMNSKSVYQEETKQYACYYATIFASQGVPVILDYVNPDSEFDESVSLPSNKPSIEIRIPEGFSATQNILSQGGITS